MEQKPVMSKSTLDNKRRTATSPTLRSREGKGTITKGNSNALAPRTRHERARSTSNASLADAKGTITRAQFRKMILVKDKVVNAEEANRLFDKLDVTGSGVLEVHKFEALYARYKWAVARSQRATNKRHTNVTTNVQPWQPGTPTDTVRMEISLARTKIKFSELRSQSAEMELYKEEQIQKDYAFLTANNKFKISKSIFRTKMRRQSPELVQETIDAVFDKMNGGGGFLTYDLFKKHYG